MGDDASVLEQLKELRRQMQEQERRAEDREMKLRKALAARDEALAARDEALAARDEELAARDEALSARDQELTSTKAKVEELSSKLEEEQRKNSPSSSFPHLGFAPSDATTKLLKEAHVERGPPGVDPVGVHLAALQALRLQQEVPRGAVDVRVHPQVVEEMQKAFGAEDGAGIVLDRPRDATNSTVQEERAQCARDVQGDLQSLCDTLSAAKAAEEASSSSSSTGGKKKKRSSKASNSSNSSDDDSPSPNLFEEAPFVPFDEESLTGLVADRVARYYHRAARFDDKHVRVMHQSRVRAAPGKSTRPIAKADVLVGCRSRSGTEHGLRPVAVFEFGLWLGKVGGGSSAKLAELLAQMAHAARHRDEHEETRPRVMLGFVVFLCKDNNTVETAAVLMRSLSTLETKRAGWAPLWHRSSAVERFAQDFELMLESTDMALCYSGAGQAPLMRGRAAIYSGDVVIKTLGAGNVLLLKGDELRSVVAPRRVGLDAYTRAWEWDGQRLGLEGIVALEVYNPSEPDAVGLAVVRYKAVTGMHTATQVGDFALVVMTLLAMHREGLVHGDIRGFNIVFAKDQTRVIDFDYVGRAGQDRYTVNLTQSLPDLGDRPEGAEFDHVLCKWHDWQGLLQIAGFHKLTGLPASDRQKEPIQAQWDEVLKGMENLVAVTKATPDNWDNEKAAGEELLRAIREAAAVKLFGTYKASEKFHTQS